MGAGYPHCGYGQRQQALQEGGLHNHWQRHRPDAGPRLDQRGAVTPRFLSGTVVLILSDIGFLGAGIIFLSRQNEKVKGLTTAATIWVMAAVGIACGRGNTSKSY